VAGLNRELDPEVGPLLDSCESVTQDRSRKVHRRCTADARGPREHGSSGASLISSCNISAIALLLNLESFLSRTNSVNLRRIESCPLNINPKCLNFTHSLTIHPSYT
jgi:hypothetical protein